ncbi:MAG: Melibiose operon regulatory protein [Mucilaginibacter sp.]|jgi:AraC-like DNA-binding protein|nr:Melibiose operon regulatory protein [Mucilaginibacter sp.]
MKVLPFTVAIPFDRTIVVQDEVLPYFYTYLHRHEEVQLTWIIEGEGTLIAGSNIHVFHAGEIYLLGPNIPHVFKSEPLYFEQGSKKQVHTISIYFNPYGKLGSLFDLPEMKSIRTLLQQFQTGFKLPYASFSDVSGRILGIQHSEGIDQIMQFLQLLKSFGSLSRIEPLAINSYTATTDNEGVRIGAIYNYIIQNFDKPISLEDVASLANMTPHAFCRYFKKHTKYTFVSFLNKIRINEACKMLVNHADNGISSVAYSCGFSSITNFNRVFKAITSKSPSSYVEKYTNSVE